MFVFFIWYFSILYIVCLHHCMYVCYMFIKYQSINQSTSKTVIWRRGGRERNCFGRLLPITGATINSIEASSDGFRCCSKRGQVRRPTRPRLVGMRTRRPEVCRTISAAVGHSWMLGMQSWTVFANGAPAASVGRTSWCVWCVLRLDTGLAPYTFFAVQRR